MVKLINEKDVLDSVSGIFKPILGQKGSPTQALFPKEKDPSSPAEYISEAFAAPINIVENAGKFLSEQVAPSMKAMYEEMEKEAEAADIVCDKVGGQSIQLPIPLIPDATICISPKMIVWASKPKNMPKLAKITAACALEEALSDPIDFWLSGAKLLQEGDIEKLSGLFTGLIGGEGIPPGLHPIHLFTYPPQFAACVQSRIAVEQGDMSENELNKLEKDITSFTGRSEGMGRKFLNEMGKNFPTEPIENIIESTGINKMVDGLGLDRISDSLDLLIKNFNQNLKPISDTLKSMGL